MLKLGLMLLWTFFGVAGGGAFTPFIPAAVYYFFAVLRPQFLWEYSLAAYVDKEFPWSLILALSAIVTAAVWRAGFWIAPRRFRGVLLPRFNVGHALFGAFAVWIVVTYLMAQQPAASEFVFAEYRKIFLMYFVTSVVLVSIRQAWILYFLVTCPLMYIAYEVNEIYLLQGGYNYIYARGFCGLDNNGAGLMLAMGIPLCVYAWDGVRHWVRWIFPVGGLLIAHAVMLSYSRGAMLSLMVSAPLYLLRCRNKKAVLALYLVSAALVPVLASDQIRDRFLSIGNHEEDGSAQSRFTTWGIAWQMAKERPIFGFGIRNSALYTYEYGADEQGRVIHSTYLQIAADSGLVGLAAYAAMMGGALYAAHRVRHRIHGYVGLTSYALAAGHFLVGGAWRPATQTGGIDGPDARRAFTIACGVEGSLVVFLIGCTFLSLETFEPPYILALLAVQLWSVLRLTPTTEPAAGSDDGEVMSGSLTPRDHDG